MRIVVVGAGIGGLTAALALQRAGRRPIVLEAAEALGEIGAGVSVTPNAVKGLLSLGLGPALEALDAAIPQQEIRAADGSPLMRIDRSDSGARYGADYLMMLRADLHGILSDAVRANDPDCIRLGQRVTDRPNADLVIAADGVRSALRGEAFGADAPRFTGHVAWRALVPAERLGAPVAKGSVVWTGPERTLVRYPVRGGAFVNLVGLSRTGVWTAEGWSHPARLDDLLAAFPGFAAEALDLWRAAPADRIMGWGLFVRDPLPSFTAPGLALIGDAAHPMLPFMGQGAAMAIEDGVVLGRCLAGETDVAAALARYDRARRDRATFVQRESAAGADRLQTTHEKSGTDLKRGEDALDIFAYDPATVALD
jgi:salicylate hydroxylase